MFAEIYFVALFYFIIGLYPNSYFTRNFILALNLCNKYVIM